MYLLHKLSSITEFGGTISVSMADRDFFRYFY